MPIEGIPEIIPEPIVDPIPPEPLRPAYTPLIFAGRDAWRAFSEDPAWAWETGDREHVWFFWFSGVEVNGDSSVGTPLIEGTEWPGLVEDVDREFEVRRRKLEVGMFSGDKNDEVYWVCTAADSQTVAQVVDKSFRTLQSQSASTSNRSGLNRSRLRIYHQFRQLQQAQRLRVSTRSSRVNLQPHHHPLTPISRL